MEIEQKLDSLIDWLTKTHTSEKDTFPTIFHYEKLRTRYRVVRTYSGQSSVYCFVDFQGNIYKAATWKSPAKHVRGHVDNLNTNDLGKYSPRYLK